MRRQPSRRYSAYRSDASSPEATDGVDRWVGPFAAALTRAVADAETYERRVAEVQAAWGVLEQTTVGRRNRAFEAPDLIDAFTDLERRLAGPDGDTLQSRPERRVPVRRR